MIPGLLAQDVAKALREFIITGFETDTWPFAGKFEQLVSAYREDASGKERPLLRALCSIGLPFVNTSDRWDFSRQLLVCSPHLPVALVFPVEAQPSPPVHDREVGNGIATAFVTAKRVG